MVVFSSSSSCCYVTIASSFSRHCSDATEQELCCSYPKNPCRTWESLRRWLNEIMEAKTRDNGLDPCHCPSFLLRKGEIRSAHQCSLCAAEEWKPALLLLGFSPKIMIFLIRPCIFLKTLIFLFSWNLFLLYWNPLCLVVSTAIFTTDKVINYSSIYSENHLI